jgi:pimeloyl-ACP methyl ester carboxylesterase
MANYDKLYTSRGRQLHIAGEGGGGGGVTSVPRDFNIRLQGGRLNAKTGLASGALTNASEFFNYLHTPNYLHFPKGIDDIDDLDIDCTNCNFTIYCYDGDLNFLGASSGYTLLDDTEYIKIMVHSNEAFTFIPLLQVSCLYHLPYMDFLKNDHMKVAAKWISFEVHFPVPDEAVSDGSYNGNTVRRYDNGFIKLPPNYSPKGEPVPLILYIHGTGGYDFAETAVKLYDDYQNFLVNNGYALCDCSGVSNQYRSISDVFGAPSHVACVLDMYRFIADSYNVQTDGVYVFGKSAGGFGTAHFANIQPIKVKAAGFLAPALNWVGSSLRKEAAVSIQLAMNQLGLGEHTFSNKIGTAEDKEYISTHYEPLALWDPWVQKSDMDIEMWYTELCFKYGYSNAAQGNDEYRALAAQTRKFSDVPQKIWVAKDDESIPYNICKMYRDMIRNANGICYLRTMPDGCGGHHAVDTSETAPVVTLQTKYGGEMTVPVAYAELLDWFNRW